MVDELPNTPELKLTGDVAVKVKFFIGPKVNNAFVEWDAVPGEPFPVMMTVKLAVCEDVQVRLEVPVPLAVNGTLVEVNRLQVRPVTVLLVNETVPTKLNVLVRVIVEVAGEPAGALAAEAVIVKSPTCTTEDAEWDAVPGEPAPVTVTK